MLKECFRLSAVTTRNQKLTNEKHNTTQPKSIERLTIPPPITPTNGKIIFDELQLRKLCDKATIKDLNFITLYNSVENNDRSLPLSFGNSIQMPDFAFNHIAALTYRGALWVPDREPLRTALIQRVHDSHVTGHPDREIY